MAECTVVSKLKTECKTLHISWCTIRTRGTCVARAGKSTLSALRPKRVNLFRKIRAPASFLFLVFSFLILRQRKIANSKKYFAVYSNKYPNFSTVQLLPALASKSFAPESSEASGILKLLRCPLISLLHSPIYYLARDCKYITRAVIGTRGQIFP